MSRPLPRGICSRFPLAVLMGAALLLAPAAAQSADGAAKPTFRAGAATANITPPLGELIVGSFEPFPATEIHDELHARCLVLDDGKTRLAIVICDNLGIPRNVLDVSRKALEESVGLPQSNILIAATHTHSATTAYSANRMDLNAELTKYQKIISKRIVEGVEQAIKNLEPARIAWGAADEPSEVFNRRWYLTPGSANLKNPFGGVDKVRMNPPRANAELIRPAGPTDPQISFLSVQAADGRPIALIGNYSLHYVGGVPKGQVSADYFAIFGELIAEKLGVKQSDDHPPFVGVLSNGTSGDINNINFTQTGESHPPYGKMRIVAERVASAVAKAHENVKFRDDITLDAAFADLTIESRIPTEEQLAYAKTILEKPEGTEKYHSLETHYANRVNRLADAPKELKIPLQALRIGDIGITAIPFEVFAETGLRIKKESALQPAFTISFANGSYAYLPTPEQHQLGGYETWLGTCNVEPEASAKIEAKLLEMLAELKKNKK